MNLFIKSGILLSIALLSHAALASTSGGLDTPNGVDNMPFAIGGTEVMTLKANGLTFPNVTGTVDGNAAQTLINLTALAPCGASQALTKTGKTTFACMAVEVPPPPPPPQASYSAPSGSAPSGATTIVNSSGQFLMSDGTYMSSSNPNFSNSNLMVTTDSMAAASAAQYGGTPGPTTSDAFNGLTVTYQDGGNQVTKTNQYYTGSTPPDGYVASAVAGTYVLTTITTTPNPSGP
jgi:hypothetical protein